MSVINSATHASLSTVAENSQVQAQNAAAIDETPAQPLDKKEVTKPLLSVIMKDIF